MQKHYHDAAGQVVEGGCLQMKVLPPDDGVRHAELEEEGLEDGDLFTWSQAKTVRGQTESLRLPGGDGVWDCVFHILSSRLSGSTNTETHSVIWKNILRLIKGKTRFIVF